MEDVETIRVYGYVTKKEKEALDDFVEKQNSLYKTINEYLSEVVRITIEEILKNEN